MWEIELEAEFLKDWASLMDAGTEVDFYSRLIQIRTNSKIATT
jgi:hypothetical protein